MDTKTLNGRTAEAGPGTGDTKRAVLYLRVSTTGQVNNDYNPEGISIPAQRAASTGKAAELRATVVDEYVEPGRTATSIERRPKFQEMMARIKTERDVDYIIVYHFNRIFRNTIDAALAKRELRKLGVRIVSTVMDLGDTPESNMVETIVGAVDEYRVQADAADIKYKMGQKAKNGGTISRAKLGYLNVRINIDGREVRTVETDAERAPFIRQGFELYATALYSAREVVDQLAAAGLKTRGNRRTAPKPLSVQQLYDILVDRYYLGVVEHEGREYPGRHEALVTPELFDRVQQVLALHGGGGTRQRRHNHYLKGTVWCGRCGSRLVIMPGKGNGGTYFYYLCRGRQDDEGCTQPYMRVEAMEAAVVRHYAAVALGRELSERIRSSLDTVMLDDLAGMSGLKKRLTARLAELDAKEDQYLELIGTPGWPKEKLRRKLDSIQAERDEVSGQLADTASKLEVGRQLFLSAMQLLRDPQAFYEQGGTSLKRAMNKIIFPKLYVDGEEISGHELGEAVCDVLEAQRVAVRDGGARAATSSQNASSSIPEDGAAWLKLTCADLLAVTLGGHGSSRPALVGGAEGIRTPGPLDANEVRYRTAPQPQREETLSGPGGCSCTGFGAGGAGCHSLAARGWEAGSSAYWSKRGVDGGRCCLGAGACWGWGCGWGGGTTARPALQVSGAPRSRPPVRRGATGAVT